MHKLITSQSAKVLQFLSGYTIALWSGFPIVWLIATFQLISVENENILYSILDCCAKCIYTYVLLKHNYYTIDQLEDLKRIEREDLLDRALETTKRIEVANRMLMDAKRDAENESNL